MAPVGLLTIKNGLLLGVAGFRDALRLHRCVVYFVHDPRILYKTGNCFLLNGFIFLGSVVLLEYILQPLVSLLLAMVVGGASAASLGSSLVGLYHLLWLAPACVVSLIVNSIWYNEIAELVVTAGQRRALQNRAQRQGVVLVSPAQQAAAVIKVHRPNFLAAVSQEVYRATLLLVFYLQTSLAGFVPRVGPLLYYFLLSCLYAMYCFDYKWSLHGVPLAQRITYFERHWAFFLGFGFATVLPLALTSFYVSTALIGLLFPLDIMMAADSNPRSIYQQVLGDEPAARGALPPLPIFRAACWATNTLLSKLSLVPRVVRLLRGTQRLAAEQPAMSETSSLTSMASMDVR